MHIRFEELTCARPCTMKFSVVTFLVLSMVASAEADKRAAKQMQINYFDDNNCNRFLGQIDVTWASKHLSSGKKNCYNYNYGNSVALVECIGDSCDCTFYYDRDCKSGSEGPWVTNDGRCHGSANQFQSFRCFYN